MSPLAIQLSGASTQLNRSISPMSYLKKKSFQTFIIAPRVQLKRPPHGGGDELFKIVFKTNRIRSIMASDALNVHRYLAFFQFQATNTQGQILSF